MIRLTRTVFGDLVIWMMTFGLLVGLTFPFFVVYIGFGIPRDQVINLWFFLASSCAGVIIGAVNFFLVKGIVGRRLHLLAARMHQAEHQLTELARRHDEMPLDVARNFVPVDSADEIGESAKAFNSLVAALSTSMHTEAVVRNFSDMLSSHLELDALTQHALEQLLQHTEADAGAILVESSGEMTVAASYGLSAPASIAGNDRLGHALRTGDRQRIALPDYIIMDGMLTTFRPREVIIEPVVYKQIPLGAIVLSSARGFPDEVGNILEMLRTGLALALNNAVAHDRLQRLAAIDPLTGIYNRRFGMARYHEEFGRAIRSTLPLGLMIFDIDHFKSVNDTYGHLVGDRVLAKVTRVARTAIREGDIMVRYGGEEFLVILPGASKADAERLGERIRRIVEEASLEDGDQSIRVTISIGCTAYPAPDITDDSVLLQRADEALYVAKQTGRNRLVMM